MSSLLKKAIPILIGKQLELRSLWAPNKAVVQAFNLFCSPQKGKVKSNEVEFLENGKLEKIVTNGHKIQTYRWEGKGDTVLLLHGWESNTYRWKALIEDLKENDFNVIAIDAPSQGYSSGKYLNVPLYTECVTDIIKKYNPQIVVGHSLGGMTAIYHEYKYPSKNIEKIVTLGPPSELPLFMNSFKETLDLSEHFMMKLDDYLYNRFGFYAGGFSISEFAKKIKVPGLLILEKRDKLAPFKYSIKIAENWNNCELYTVENIGHSLQSKGINEKIIAFIKGD